MFKPTSSSISSMVGTLWAVNFCIFFILTQKLKPKIQITRPEKKFRVRILPWLQFDWSKNFSFNQRTICTLSVYSLQQNVCIAIKTLNSILRRHYGFIMSALGENILLPTGRHYKVEFSLYYAHYHWAHKTYEPLPPPIPERGAINLWSDYQQFVPTFLRHTHWQSHPSPNSCVATSSSTSSEYPSKACTATTPHSPLCEKHRWFQTTPRPLHCSPNGTAISIRAHLKLKITPLSLCPSLNQHHKSAKPTPVRLKPAQRSPVQLK